MKPSHLVRALRVLLETDRPAFLHGPPGVGKSDIVRTVAAELGWPVVDVRAVLLDPVDLRGLPVVDVAAGTARWVPPAFLPSTPGPGLLFLDELATAPMAVQSACLQLCLDRAVGEYRLPDGWRILAAGNRASDRAGAGRLSTALASRFVHLDLEVSHADWQAWARGPGKVHPTIRAFLNFREPLLFHFDPAENPERFPCPRTWAFAGELYGALEAAGELAIELPLIAGAVGQAAAAEFVAFSRIARDLPTVDVILAAPATAPVPKDCAVLFAVATMLGARAAEIPAASLPALLEYTERLPAEFQVLLMRDAFASCPDIMLQPAAARWAQRHAGLLGVA